MRDTRIILRWLLTAALVAAVCCGAVPPLGALVLGVVVAAVCGTPRHAPAAARHLLALSICALGFGVDLATVLAAGCDGMLATALLLGLTFGLGALLGRRFGVSADVALLITAGTAICGGSAIAAVAPLIRARAADVAAAVGVVFLLNAAALAVFPGIGTSLGLDAQAFGQWCALAIHDTSSVVGAAATHSEAALEIATVTKLTRMLWLVPIGGAIVRVRARRSGRRDAARPTLPWFLIGFLVAASIVTAWPETRPLASSIARQAPLGMTLAMFAVGLCLTSSLRGGVVGRALGFGLTVWAVLAIAALLYVCV